MIDIDKATIPELQLALAEKEKDCPTGLYATEGTIHHQTPSNKSVCPDCRGTGKVPLLEGIREPCPNYNAVEHYREGSGHTLQACRKRQDYCRQGGDECQGCGWVATQDAWKWFKAIFSDQVKCDHWLLEFALVNGDELAFYRAVAKAVLK